MSAPEDEVESPCIGLCMMNDTLGYCLGCGRTRREIASWPGLSGGERLMVIERARERSGLPLIKKPRPDPS